MNVASTAAADELLSPLMQPRESLIVDSRHRIICAARRRQCAICRVYCPQPPTPGHKWTTRTFATLCLVAVFGVVTREMIVVSGCLGKTRHNATRNTQNQASRDSHVGSGSICVL